MAVENAAKPAAPITPAFTPAEIEIFTIFFYK